MTFGQHLEELRVCLFKAILGLGVGCLIGLVAGGYVVDFIQTPVRKALNEYYETQAIKKVKNDLTALREAGYSLPSDDEKIKEFVAEKNLAFEEVYVNPKELLRQLQPTPAGRSARPAPPAADEKPFSSDELVRVFLWRRIADDPRVRLKSLNSQETFMIYLKASLLVGAIVASPWVFYQIWTFVATGLYPRERRYVHLFLPLSLGLFLAGAALAFFCVFAPVLGFLLSFNSMLGIDPDLRISEWLGFVLLLPLAFGISFQLPLVMLFLERVGIVTVKQYVASWRIAVLTIFILAMLLLPTGDPYSLLLMACPLVRLYYGGVLLCRFMPRREEGALRD